MQYLLVNILYANIVHNTVIYMSKKQYTFHKHKLEHSEFLTLINTQKTCLCCICIYSKSNRLPCSFHLLNFAHKTWVNPSLTDTHPWCHTGIEPEISWLWNKLANYLVTPMSPVSVFQRASLVIHWAIFELRTKLRIQGFDYEIIQPLTKLEYNK